MLLETEVDVETVAVVFDNLEDPRIARKKLYPIGQWRKVKSADFTKNLILLCCLFMLNHFGVNPRY